MILLCIFDPDRYMYLGRKDDALRMFWMKNSCTRRGREEVNEIREHLSQRKRKELEISRQKEE